ncbi:MAG: hypothetical protein QMD92_00305 [bacterium]|nr:hypothetical protein [bacterium]
MGYTIIKGNTVDEQLASADKALSHLERRINARSIVAPLTPMIISGFCKEDEDGVILKVLLPISGYITKLSFFIDDIEDVEFLKKNFLVISIEARLADGTLVMKKFPTKQLAAEVFTSYKVEANSCITVLVNTKVRGVWYGFVVEPELSIKRKVDVSILEE